MEFELIVCSDHKNLLSPNEKKPLSYMTKRWKILLTIAEYRLTLRSIPGP